LLRYLSSASSLFLKQPHESRDRLCDCYDTAFQARNMVGGETELFRERLLRKTELGSDAPQVPSPHGTTRHCA